MIASGTIDAVLLAALRAEVLAWPDALQGEEALALAGERAGFHGIELALCRDEAVIADWPEPLRDRLRDAARLQALWEVSHRRTLIALLDAFAQGGVDVLVTKGTALAYSVYPDPALRRRGDTDLLVRPNQLKDARKVLREVGFAPDSASVLQEDWHFDTGAGFVHVVDLHWHANSSFALRQMFTAEEGFASAHPLPTLADNALAIGPILLFLQDALNHALHRADGYNVEARVVRESERYIWTWGTHLQALNFTEVQWQALGDEACSRGMAHICLAALVRAQSAFGTDVPPAIAQQLASSEHGAIDAYLLDAGTMERFAANWRGSTGWRGRADLVKRNLLPSRDYMEELYPGMVAGPLGLMYLRRWLSLPLRITGWMVGGRH